MTAVGEFLILVIAIAVILVALVAGLVTTGVRRPRRRTPARPARSHLPGTPPRGSTAPPTEAPGTVTDEPHTGATAVPTVERPEGTASRLVRLRQRLSRSQGALGRGLLALLSRDRLDEDTWEEIEDTLLSADIGVAPTQQLVERLRTRLRIEGTGAASPREVLREELLALVEPGLDRTLAVSAPRAVRPSSSWSGSTAPARPRPSASWPASSWPRTSRWCSARPTRSAPRPSEQLTTWGHRVGVETVRGPEGSDPASVAFESVRTGMEQEADVVLVDTAGRLQNKAGPHGRARQGQAGRREAGTGDRGAARPRRDHRPERHDAGTRVLARSWT